MKLGFKRSKRSLFQHVLRTCLVFWTLVLTPFAAHARSPVIMVTTISCSDDSVSLEERTEFANQVRKTLIKAKQKIRVVGERRTAQILAKFDLDEQECTSECAAQIGELRNIDFVLWGRVEQTGSGLVGELAIFSTQNGSLISSKRRERYSFDDLSSTLLASLPFLFQPLELLSFSFSKYRGNGKAEDDLKSSQGLPRVAKDGQAKRDLWEESRQEPPLFGDDDRGFLGTRVSLGFSFLLQHASYIKNAFTPLYHLSIDVHYQVLPLFQIAIVGDLAQLRGESATSRELFGDVCEVDDCTTKIQSDFDTFWMLGVRPTIRLNLVFDVFETFFGFGMGFMHTSTLGKWSKSARVVDDSGAKEQRVRYRFEQSQGIFYSAFELAGMFRMFERRMGLGLLLQYTLPVCTAAGATPRVEIISNSSLDAEGEEAPLFEPDREDYRGTLVSQLGSFGLLTVGLTVNYVF